MNWKAFIISNAFVIALVIGLAVTRVINYAPDEALEDIQEIELSIYEPPAEPEIEELSEPEPLEDIPPPPPPTFSDLAPATDLSAVVLPKTDISISIDTQTDLFSTERAPAPLIVQKKAESVKPTKPKIKISRVKSGLSLGDLDAKPKVLRLGTLRWPRGVRVQSVEAMLRVELNEQGRVKLLEVVSIEDERFRSKLDHYVKTTRFTVPKKNGKPVKLPFNWPIILKRK